MRLLNRIRSFFRGLAHRGEDDRELDAEVRAHAEMLADEKVREGMSAQEAWRAARLEIGGIEQVKEEVRSARPGVWLETFWQDVRFGARMLRKNPGTTAIAVLTLALGIGANTAIFSVVNAVLLRPISAPEPDRVVVFMDTDPSGSTSLASEIKFNVWKEATNIFQDVSAYRPGSRYLTGVDQPQKADAIYVTEDYFHLFGLPLARGRSFTASEEQPNGPNVVVISDTFWKTVFDGDPQIIGKTISLSENSYQVIGVLAGNIHMENIGPTNGPMRGETVPDVWLPFVIDPNSSNQNHYFQAVGRLKPGVTLDMANAQLQLTTQEFRRKFPNSLATSRGDVFSVQPLRDLLVKRVRPSLWMLACAVTFVLLIACANIAGLLLAQATSRGHEIAIRTAIGASRGRIIRHLLTESILLSLLGAVFGLALGLVGIRAFLAFDPYNIPRLGVNASNIALDWQVLTYTLAVALITGVLFGLMPAFQMSRINLNDSLKEGGGQTGAGLRQGKGLSLLVISEISLALVLLIGAGLLVRGLIALRSVNPGFDPHNVVTTRTTIDPRFANVSTLDQAIEGGIRRVSALPGVETVSTSNVLPLEGLFASVPITVVGRPVVGPSPAAGHGNARFMTISAGYFDALKIPLIRGRLFTDADGASAPGVAIINEAMARKFWPDGEPLNAQIFIARGVGPGFDEPARRIVGVVANVHDDELDRDPDPAVFVPIAQRLMAQKSAADRVWIVRVRGRTPALDAAIQGELRQAIGGLPVPPLRSMEEVTAKSTARQDFNMRLLTMFGCVALVIAAIGIYGLTAYTVDQRRREVAIRMTLGAQQTEILKMVIGSGMRLALIGVCIGVAGALGLTRFLSSILFGVKPTDPVTFVIVVLILFAVALMACYLPARRVMRADPMVSLRHE
ncbi:MAG: ABC transporter permease [Candidatus Acidiferrales bacterium]